MQKKFTDEDGIAEIEFRVADCLIKENNNNESYDPDLNAQGS